MSIERILVGLCLAFALGVLAGTVTGLYLAEKTVEPQIRAEFDKQYQERIKETLRRNDACVAKWKPESACVER